MPHKSIQVPIEIPIYKFNTHPLSRSPRLKHLHNPDCVVNAFEAMGILDTKSSRVARDLVTDYNQGVKYETLLKWLDDVEMDKVANTIVKHPSMTVPAVKQHVLVELGVVDVKRLFNNLPDKHGMFVIVHSNRFFHAHITIVVRWDNKLGVLDPQVIGHYNYTKLEDISSLDQYVHRGYAFAIIAVKLTK